MKIQKIVTVLLIGSALHSCAGEEDRTEESIQENTEETTVEEIEIKDEALEGLTMNLGEKWKVDETTDQGMARVDSMVSNFNDDDYKNLGKSIKKELKDIINQCTMKGEDHNQYHIVLHAMMKESKALKKGNSETTEKMERYLAAYYAHFEL